ncbi:hypothetical protein [uncultured Chryseobacterium sp.]|uniref:hypothetical protein n=1 Tax=uncultured Chryseobacterium sp. TaxID=259322 RepID=UPI0027DBCC8A|nr:hypothetical protein [uncultured Chryseobacterium sp.]
MASVVETVLFGSEEGSVISSEELQDNAKKQMQEQKIDFLFSYEISLNSNF